MTGEQRWRQALADEQAEPSDWRPDLAALEQRLAHRDLHVLSHWWAFEVALAMRSREATDTPE